MILRLLPLHQVSNANSEISQAATITLKLVKHYVLEDPLQVFYKDFSSETGFNSHFKRKSFNFLTSHPVLCGLIVFRIKLLIQHVGISLEYVLTILISAAHLYNAASQQEPCEPWRDMEIIIHGENTLFIGSRPTKSDEFCRRFRLVSELNLAADCALTSLQAYFKHAQSYPTEDTKKVQDIACMALRLITQYIKKDIFLELYKEFSFDNAVEIGHQMKRKPFNFLSSYSVLCGLMAVCTFSESLYPFECLIAHEAFAALRTRLSLSR